MVDQSVLTALVTLLAAVSDTITTGGKLAVGSASVGFGIGVQERSAIALFVVAVSDSVAAEGEGGFRQMNNGVSGGLDVSGPVGEAVLVVGKGVVLVVGHGLDLREDQP